MKVQYQYAAAEHIEKRKASGPPRTKAKHAGFNNRLALLLTGAVGTMWCAYAFAVLALVAMPDAIKGGMMTTIQWLSQTFIQLVMLSVIMVGQNILGQAGDRRAELTYKDAEATFEEAKQIQLHLQQQDDAINAIIDRLEALQKAAERRQA